MTELEIVAKFKTSGAGCCTDWCIPESKVLEMLKYALLVERPRLERESRINSIDAAMIADFGE